ncbi:50S ribosomal protein L10 [Gemmata sp. SH-PL17]|uniref:Large ribosomal subunit protein uL10 n=1 Tax=Gemmata massiliana TaxID=1210884 RepID=A0A6P2D8C7_9BACT|nr:MULTISPECIES: 50S ribosomal protein L10 [Gemmata]AMV24648.1 50S ribosomal protein L10 [Gemmata sp. SH-PL17]VTR96635.1 50s ribosomal protein l10 : 50S ribosomal protein L10 OS=Rhodopirellula maiorica SM1 GN=RMSM_03399 PE=3 SV=1: Ribosomal_L10 [Gemmata massiliana]
MSKKIKELELNDLRKTFKGVRDFVLLEPLKLDSAADYTLRKNLRDKKVRVKMVKNSFVKKVFDENGMKVDPGSGPTLLCWGADSPKALGTAVDAVLKQLRPDPKLPEKVKAKTGIADGELMPLDQLKVIPTRQEAIGDVLNALLSAGSSIVGALTGPATQLAGILKAIEEKGEGAPAPAAG